MGSFGLKPCYRGLCPRRHLGVSVRYLIWPLMVLVALSLSACGLPRGAALQSEILRQSDAEFPDIAVYPVTRAFLPVVQDWPRTGVERSHGWLAHGHNGAEIIIRPFDTVDLTVWDAEDNSLLTSPGQKLVEIAGLRVNERGQIFVPYLGQLRVAGRTPDSARNLVEREMTAIVPSAQVQLRVTPGTRGSVSLIGGVQNPGNIPLPEGHFTVLNLISMGGGPSDLRNPQIRLIRDGRTYLTSYDTLLKNPERDTVLHGGDKVALIEDTRYFRALGASGKEELIYFEQDRLTALDALSLMGGINDRRADPKGVLILREYEPSSVRFDDEGPNNTRTVFTLDLTTSDGLFSAGKLQVFPQDTVLATESPITAVENVVRLIGSLTAFQRFSTN